jgi:hypothetical protein
MVDGVRRPSPRVATATRVVALMVVIVVVVVVIIINVIIIVTVVSGAVRVSEVHPPRAVDGLDIVLL